MFKAIKPFIFLSLALSACSVDVMPVSFVAQNEETCKEAEEVFDDVADFYAGSVDLVWNGCKIQEDLPDSVSFSTLDYETLNTGDFPKNSANEIVIHVISKKIEVKYPSKSIYYGGFSFRDYCEAVTVVKSPKSNIVIHEIGHHLGLDHEESKLNFMNSKANNQESTENQMNKASKVAQGLIQKCGS